MFFCWLCVHAVACLVLAAPEVALHRGQAFRPAPHVLKGKGNYHTRPPSAIVFRRFGAYPFGPLAYADRGTRPAFHSRGVAYARSLPPAVSRRGTGPRICARGKPVSKGPFGDRGRYGFDKGHTIGDTHTGKGRCIKSARALSALAAPVAGVGRSVMAADDIRALY